MRTLVRLAPAAALAALLAGPAAAQQPPPATSPPAQTPSTPAPTPSTPAQTPSTPTSTPSASSQSQTPGLTVASDSLIGTKVHDAQGKEIGKISRLMIDAKQGKIASALIKQGGALGVGSKEISVPWEGLTLQRGKNQDLVVTMQQQYLEQAPSASPANDREQGKKQQ
jgi:sporulation protein YlmC with PRC-barrel domain